MFWLLSKILSLFDRPAEVPEVVKKNAERHLREMRGRYVRDRPQPKKRRAF